jgi:hypothetical protein
MGQSFSFSESLMGLTNSGLGDAGGPLVFVGGVVACLAVGYRVAQGWPGQGSAALGLAGFAAFLAGVLMVAGQWGRLDDGSSGLDLGLGYGLSIGFWVELAFGVAGALICLFNLARPIHSPYFNAAPAYWTGAGQAPWPATQPWPAPRPSPAPQWPAQPAQPGQPDGPQIDATTSAAEAAKGRVIVASGSGISTTEVSAGQTVVLGSDPGVDIVLADPAASQRQLSVSLTSTGWRIQPLDQANPAFLRDSAGLIGMLLAQADIVAGELAIGSTRVILGPPSAA